MLRERMAREMLHRYRWRPLQLYRVMRIINAYRKAQEALRASGGRASLQLDSAIKRCGRPRDAVEACIREWMFEAPLPHLAPCMPADLKSVLEQARAAGIKLALCSDYPAEAKLRAMGIRDCFDTVVAAQDAEVDRFKPDPRGLLLALRRLGVEPPEAFFLGDREDGDGLAASRAAIPHRIVKSPAEVVAYLRSVSSAGSR